MLLDEQGEKMSKSNLNQSLVLDPEDFISGSVKLDGSRKHGDGLDTMRLWAISKDSDANSFVAR